MANPLYNEFGGGQSGTTPMFQWFQRFMMQNQGRDPNQMIDSFVRSGKLTQEQLNMVQQRARLIEGQLNQFKSMFGF